MAVRPEFVRDAAVAILHERQPSSTLPEQLPDLGVQWTTRFLRRHGYLTRPRKILDLKRKEAENTEVIIAYFSQLAETIKNEGILPDDTWNMDETGFRIGIGTNDVIRVSNSY
ncbi:hypothetical protein S40288_10167 [Stachybotrys chartarum IBT 40288]|nr:hypothetical protein S40288_10167 [Stachybotrys chartarum IBT 40288]